MDIHIQFEDKNDPWSHLNCTDEEYVKDIRKWARTYDLIIKKINTKGIFLTARRTIQVDIKDVQIQNLTRDVAKWKGRMLEVTEATCDNCKALSMSRKVDTPCAECRIRTIREEATK